MGDTRSEATLVDARNLLVASVDQRLGFDFFGAVVNELPTDVAGKTLYLTGDVARFRGQLAGAARIFAVEELAHNYDSLARVRLGRVPVRVGGVGVYYRLGLTFRTSKTRLRFVDGHPTLPNGAHLTLATEDQRRELFQMRRRENDETNFVYPQLSYTVSESDLLPPAP